MHSLLKKNVSQLIKNEKDEDKDILAKIQNSLDDLNGQIASLSGIKEFEDKLTPEYQKFRKAKKMQPFTDFLSIYM